MNNIQDIIKSLSARLQAIDYNYSLRVEKGFYNSDREGMLSSTICKCINWLIKISGKAGLLIAPFIFLSCSRQEGKS